MSPPTLRALVIDDSRAMRMILRNALTGMGYQVVEAVDGQQGLDSLQAEGPFTVALVDWNMPVKTGYEFVKEARANDAFKPMKIVMVTTEIETAQVVKALTAGADEYVMKPFTPEVLRDKLAMLLAA